MGHFFCSSSFEVFSFGFFFKRILILEGHKGHFEHRSFLATGVLPTLTTSQLMGCFLWPLSIEAFYFVFLTLFDFGGT